MWGAISRELANADFVISARGTGAGALWASNGAISRESSVLNSATALPRLRQIDCPMSGAVPGLFVDVCAIRCASDLVARSIPEKPRSNKAAAMIIGLLAFGVARS